MRISITGSKSHRVWKCPASAILPQVAGDDAKYEPARAKGTAIHRFLETVKQVGVDDALDAVQGVATRLICQAIDLDDMPANLATEVAFAWNWRTGTARLLLVKDRAYDLADPPIDWYSEVPLTLDITGIAGAKGIVSDYKSGHGKYPAPDQFGQTMLGALCMRSVYGCEEVVVELIHIHDDGTNHKARRTVDEWDMDHFAREFRAAMELVGHWETEYAAGRGVATQEGPHCQYCDAYKSCPSKVALVRAIPTELMRMGVKVGADGALVFDDKALSASNKERLADAWMMRERIVEVLNRIGADICSLASYEEVPLPDGRVIGKLRTERRDLDGKIVRQVLEKRYGIETANAAIEIESSFAAVHQAVARNIRPGEKMKTKKGDGVEDAVIAAIDQAGGITVKVTESVKPHVPKTKRLPSAR